MKLTVKLTVLTALCLALCACGQSGAGTPQLLDCPVQHETEFGGVYITRTIDEFNDLGFAYGDIVMLTFSNGYALDDLPYYSGFYAELGQPLLLAYPGYDYIKATVNYGDDLWEIAGLEEDCTASITLKERGTYADIQVARDIHYTDDRADYDSDETFANFRCVQAGSLRADTLYRAASPCDNQHNRAPYVDALMEQAGVNCILDLADTREKIDGYLAREDFASPYFRSLYEDGKVLPLGLTVNYASEAFTASLVQGLTDMAAQEGPYLVHCTEGKDRTGFVCMLLEALAGASYQEIADDYMLTYGNYYGITKESDPDKYEILLEKNLVDMVRFVAGDETVHLAAADLAECAKEYLRNAGMSEQAITALQARLTE